MIHGQLFEGLTRLKQLEFSYNQIEIIPVHIFDDLADIELISLNDNHIQP